MRSALSWITIDGWILLTGVRSLLQMIQTKNMRMVRPLEGDYLWL